MSTQGSRISKEQWQEHKELIRQLYVIQRVPLKQISRHLEETYSFRASKAQYDRRLKEWGFSKNIKAFVSQAIENSLQRQDLDSTTAVVVANGVPMSPRRLKRVLRRHNLPTLEDKWNRVGIEIRPVSRPTHDIDKPRFDQFGGLDPFATTSVPISSQVARVLEYFLNDPKYVDLKAIMPYALERSMLFHAVIALSMARMLRALPSDRSVDMSAVIRHKLDAVFELRRGLAAPELLRAKSAYVIFLTALTLSILEARLSASPCGF
ncbi:hypothetical protein H2200_009891 [Cladophialophora chaetospira]|uniref:Clr5 domain-containing protein n=1 Tax=Cladophialophora chaetospira TaxID=386627 RepID=A0AA38X3E2_9EURO|nr:hypothetical protein H2200_009891 [Cladophialophora chaetospira]